MSAPDGTVTLRDEFTALPVVDSQVVYQGVLWDVCRDRVDLGDGRIVTREYIPHGGAVAIIAMRRHGGQDEIVMIRQYRHAAGGYLWEVPAGLLDIAGEAPHAAAARELAEEVDLIAGRWHVLVDAIASPGSFPENLRIFLAQDLAPAAETHDRTDEEADLQIAWVALDTAYDAVLAGDVHNPGAVIGIMAAHGARERGWTTLRPADAPWPAHPGFR